MHRLRVLRIDPDDHARRAVRVVAPLDDQFVLPPLHLGLQHRLVRERFLERLVVGAEVEEERAVFVLDASRSNRLASPSASLTDSSFRRKSAGRCRDRRRRSAAATATTAAARAAATASDFTAPTWLAPTTTQARRHRPAGARAFGVLDHLVLRGLRLVDVEGPGPDKHRSVLRA